MLVQRSVCVCVCVCVCLWFYMCAFLLPGSVVSVENLEEVAGLAECATGVM